MNFPFSRLRSLFLFLPLSSALCVALLLQAAPCFLCRLSPSLTPLSLFSVYLHISPPCRPFSESRGGSRLLLQPAPPRSLPFSHPVRLYALLSSKVRSLLRVCPSIRPSRHSPHPFRLFLRVFVSLFLSVSRFLSLLRIYRGEQRMWMGWVSPRLGERSITCEPKGEEIRGCAAVPTGTKRSASRNGGIRNTRAVCPTPLSLSPSIHPSVYPYVPPHDFSRIRPPFFLSAFPLPRSLPHITLTRVPIPYVQNEPRVIHHNRFMCTSTVRTFARAR